jgi:hypothetical protein
MVSEPVGLPVDEYEARSDLLNDQTIKVSMKLFTRWLSPNYKAITGR